MDRSKSAILVMLLVGVIAACSSSTTPATTERVGNGAQAMSSPSDDEPANGVEPKGPHDTICDFGCSQGDNGKPKPGAAPGLPPAPPPPPVDTPNGPPSGGGTTTPPKSGASESGETGGDDDGDGTNGGAGAGSGEGSGADRPNKPGKGNKPLPDDVERPKPCPLGGATDSYEEPECIDISRYCILDEEMSAAMKCFFEEESKTASSLVSRCWYRCFEKDGTEHLESEMEQCMVLEWREVQRGSIRDKEPVRWTQNCSGTFHNPYHW